MKTVGMVGIGLMGHGIASNIARHGYPMMLFEHEKNQPLDALRAAGARTTPDFATLANAADIIILCVTGTPEVEDVLFREDGLLASVKPGAIIIDCSTAMPASTERIAATLKERGVHFLDAAMTRTPKEAAAGRLNLIVGGDEAIFEQVRPLLQTYAENIVYAGPSGSGHRLKLIHNFVSLGFSAVLAEAAACARRADISTEVFLEVLGKGGGAGVILDRFRPYLETGDKGAFSFYIANAVKDIGYYSKMAAENSYLPSLSDSVLELYALAGAELGAQAVVPEAIEALAGSRSSRAMSIEIDDPRMTDLVDPTAQPEQICTGFKFTEGPIWNPREQALYFSDMPGDVRRRWSAADGVREVRNPSNKCNGMTYDGVGNLIVCEHVTSSLVREIPAGERSVLASHWEGRELNSPNDVVVRSDGTIYFSDPSYGRWPGFGLEREQDLDFQGVFSVSPDGRLWLEARDFGQPNGLCFSPDERILYVNDSDKAHIRMFDVAADGRLSNSRIFFEGVGDGSLEGGIVDGMKCDERGNIYVTGPRGIWVIAPEGRRLGVLPMPEHAGNMNWGGADWHELYCACSTSIYRLKLKVRGAPTAYMALK